MALFKCKMCGGDLETVEGVTITECEYCGTKQTVPKVLDENLQNLFNRANTLRIKSEFDKAEKLYERIIQADPTQPEAYWGLILCKYGIEYVDDPATYKKVPTCHRASYDSVIADDDYKSALKNADITQRTIYEEQATEIDRIQKEILALAQKEENYDVFICYKETDENGRRTQDSVIANDIYYQLKQEGFKVFYAAITLEGKLGSAYEPIIFAALNSAKVMLAIGTKPEYFNAVWVKNEWSRYIKIIKKDRSKLLIPCYRDMDAYDLPEEFAHLQAQDMSKIGFINDIVRGIQKVLKKDELKATVVKETVVKETVVNSTSSNTSPLLERAFMFLEDEDWDSANEYCEKVLDLDPKNAKAYLGKLMVDLKVRKKENLKDCSSPFDSNANYNKILRFGDGKIKAEMHEIIEHIKTRIKNEQLESEYKKIVADLNLARDMKYTDKEAYYKTIAKRFEALGDYKDAQTLSKECLKKAEKARIEAIEQVEQERIAANKQAECKRKDEIYNQACLQRDLRTIKGFEIAINLFGQIPDWRDSQAQATTCETRLENLKAKLEQRRVEEEKAKIERARKAELARIEAEKARIASERITKIITPILILLFNALFVFYIFTFIDNVQEIDKFSKIFQNCWKEWIVLAAWWGVVGLLINKYTEGFAFPVITLGPIAFIVLGLKFINTNFILGLIIVIVRLLIPTVIGFFWAYIVNSLIPVANKEKGIEEKHGFITFICFVLLAVSIVGGVYLNNEYKVRNLRAVAQSVSVDTIASTNVLADTVHLYQKLTDKQQQLLTTEEINKFDSYVKVQEITSLINQINDNLVSNYDKVEEVKKIYNSLNEQYRPLVSNYYLVDIFEDEWAFYKLFRFEQLSDGTYSIKVKDPNALSGAIEIPSRYNNQEVTIIPEGAFKDCNNVTSFVVPNTVTQIGVEAFRGCENLEEISIPFIGKSGSANAYEAVLGYIFGYENGDTSDGYYGYVDPSMYVVDWDTAKNSAWASDTFINRQIGAVSKAVWQYTARNHLGSIYYYPQSYHYYIPETLKKVVVTNQTNIPIAAFNSCTMLETITFKQGISSQGEYAFQNCTATIIEEN